MSVVLKSETGDERGTRLLRATSHPAWVWLICLLLGLGVADWAFTDSKFDLALAGFDGMLGQAVDSDPIQESESTIHLWRPMILGLILLTVFMLLVLLFLLAFGLFGRVGGSKNYRSLKALLMLVTLTGLWIGLFVSLPNIAWYGKQARIGRMLESFEPIVGELRNDWPVTDGNSPTLGPYKSYPISKPTTLMLMVSPELAENGARLTQVERAENGSLRFLLAGSELGDWVEWHPDGSEPDSFQNSLQGEHVLSRSADFGGGWFLVRYR